ncbi:MAG: polyprenyl synthetase family protein [Flavobacteriaceae bacterium]
MKAIEKYQSHFLNYLTGFNKSRNPRNLYDPVKYILEIGGKRLRPILTLMITDCFGGNTTKALDAALAIEVFHNFSLVHDDIMDNAPLRRNKKTVHEKWDINTGILSGDAMLIMAYKLFESYDADKFHRLTTLFSKTALEVCEGQQYDIDFESRFDVTIDEYIKMIEYKTAVLVASAMQMGAIIAETSIDNQKKCFEFGKNLGIAFQLQDDYLDAYGDPKSFGKQVGGDIIENKKTYLYLKAMHQGSDQDKLILKELYKSKLVVEDKISKVLEIFERSGAAQSTKDAIQYYTENAFLILESIEINDTKKGLIRDFGTELMTRSS